MTNKEALAELYKQLKNERTTTEILSNKEQYENIYKALEALDILKKCDELDTLYCVYVLNAHSRGKITDREVYFIKEWLHND